MSVPRSAFIVHRLRVSGVAILFSKLSSSFVCLLFCAASLYAGAPFQTDDPVPTDLRHWEVYLFEAWDLRANSVSATLPGLEIDYGAIPQLQIHVLVPVGLNLMTHRPEEYGLADIEYGAKFRFLSETAYRPQFAVYPAAHLPTGSSARGLGPGHAQIFLPLWLQKSWGPWTSYGGGGYWISPGHSGENHAFFGWLLQRDLSEKLTLGGELFHNSASNGDPSRTGFNLGVIASPTEHGHLLISMGRDVTSGSDFTAYLGWQWTFGPWPSKS
jgi:hypothetical protein